MAALKLLFPQSMLFTTPYRVQVGDLNYGNHLANDKVLLLVHEARMRWLQQIGQSELNFFGQGLIMRDAQIQYTRQAHYGDSLALQLAAGQVFAAGFELYARILHADGTPVAIVLHTLLSFDYAAQKVARLSLEAVQYLSKDH